jgi:hypothetical protein
MRESRMSNVKLNVKRDASGHVALYKNKKEVTSVEIKKNVKMKINIGDGFNAGATVSSFSLFENVRGTKGNDIGTWDRTNPATQPSDEIDVAADGAAAIVVTDTDRSTVDELFYFSIQVTDGKKTYDTDPELKVKRVTN